jgi:coenzyme Q-binding protein COQ10
MVAGYGLLKDSFTSEVALTPPARIEVTYKDGPFRYLHNTWSFSARSDNECEVVFHIDFAFRSGLFNRAMASFFSEAVRIMVQAFENRAHQLYRLGDIPYSVITSEAK